MTVQLRTVHDFHNFNVCFRDNQKYEVVAFTAAQIPGIARRIYPPELSGPLYKKGIMIYPEQELPELIKKFKAEKVVLAYTDLSYQEVMHKAALVNACGADFVLLSPEKTMLKSRKPVISVCAVRTGSGKSTVSRKICEIIKEKGLKPVVVRHPMPYGDLTKQIIQRFEIYEDFEKQECTIEEREEYEQHVEKGNIVFAGVDYKKILRKAEKEADVIVWDGGNNDLPFYKPDLHIVVADALRPGHELSYYPSEANLRMADVVIINKQDSAEKENVETIKKNIRKINSKAVIINARMVIRVENPRLIKGKKVLVVEDGPTLTHGGMSSGAGLIAAEKYECKVVDPRKYAVGSIKKAFAEYLHIGPVLPALGYSGKQINELEQTINRTECDAVIIATPLNLRRLLKISQVSARVSYELEETSKPDLKKILENFFKTIITH